MIEIIKEAGTVLRDLPDLAIWILVGILFYKVFIIGGAIGLAKFAITKLHDYLVRPKEVIRKVDFEGNTIDQHVYEKLMSTIDLVKRHKGNIGLSCIHNGHAVWLKEAVQEKIEREKGDE